MYVLGRFGCESEGMPVVDGPYNGSICGLYLLHMLYVSNDLLRLLPHAYQFNLSQPHNFLNQNGAHMPTINHNSGVQCCIQPDGLITLKVEPLRSS